MKVTVQNGARHGLSRRDVESILPLLPRPWFSSVRQIVLYQGEGETVAAVFYPKDQTLGLFWPREATEISKGEGVEELLVALSVATERGDLPTILSRSIRERHRKGVASTLEKCLEAMERNAV